MKIGGLTIDGTFGTAGLVLSLSGDADMRESAELTTCLLDWHKQALGKTATEVRIDVREVSFMNSTALGAFVAWVAVLQKVAASERYRMIFEGKPDKRWQRASLHALASFAPEHISVSF